MNGFIKKIAVALMSLALMTPMVDAQNHRTSGNRGGNHTTSSSQRPGNNSGNRPASSRPSSRPATGNSGSHNNSGSHGNYRPGGNNNNSGNNNHRPGNSDNDNHRPGNSGNDNHRPGNSGNNNHRPGNSGNDNHRPGNSGNNNHRPGNSGNNNRPGNSGNDNHRPGNSGNNNHRPGNSGNNNHRPGNEWHFGRPNGGNHGHVTPPRPGHNRPPMIAPPMRPHRPVAHRWSRPVPSPAWRPRPHAPSISAILGITFGTAFNISLDYLFGKGYIVDGYGDNRVYLRDVNQFNYYWPDATLYYGNSGLTRSEFLYSTSYPDMMRYNSLYNSLTGTYGPPVDYVTSGASVTATWFAPNRGYVTLQYAPQYSIGGALRYFTTISFGL